jgi:outer membrane receptor protein involved in Fe transport
MRHPCALLAILFLSLVCTARVHAQGAGSVSGAVVDSATGKPLVSATVLLRDLGDTLGKPLGDITDASGRFTVERVPFGRRLALEVSYIGYARRRIEPLAVSAETPELRLGAITLAEMAIGTEEVSVTSKRPDVIVGADKTTYAVENNPTYTATSVSELLGQIPSVDVDQDGKISLRGDENVTIMMNDRPLSMPVEQRNKLLQSLPASVVKDIEVRTTPGAQFDARNRAGIINIVTRRTMSDLVGGNVNGGFDSRVSGNAGAGLYYNGDALNASLGGGFYRSANTSSSRSLRINYRDSVDYRNEGGARSSSTSGSYHGHGQVDYKFGAHDLASLSFSVNGWSSDYTSDGAYTFYDAGGAIVRRSFDTSSPGSGTGNDGGYNSASALLRHTFEGDHRISLDFTYDQNGYRGASRYTSTYFDAAGARDSLRSSERSTDYDRSTATYITSLDYDDPITTELKLSLGARNEINRLDNSTSVRVRDHESGELVIDTVQTSHYLPHNTIYAAYANVAYRPVEALGVQAGVRIEAATVSAEYASGATIVTRDYTNVFPSASISYTVADGHTITASYRRSVALPDIEALNPTRVRWSDFAESSGNPDLEPELTNSFELKYDTFWEGGNMVSVSPYYSTTSGNIESSEQLVDGVTRSSSANFNGSYSIGADASVSMRPWTWLNFRVGGDLYSKVNRGSEIPGDRYSAASGYNGNASINADVLDATTLSVTMYTSRPAAVGGSTSSGWNYWSLGLRQRLFDRKLTISLRVNDPFDLQKWENTYQTADFRSENSSKWSSRSIGLNLSYMFGTQPRMEEHHTEKTETKGSGGSAGGGGTGGGSGGGQ